MSSVFEIWLTMAEHNPIKEEHGLISAISLLLSGHIILVLAGFLFEIDNALHSVRHLSVIIKLLSLLLYIIVTPQSCSCWLCKIGRSDGEKNRNVNFRNLYWYLHYLSEKPPLDFYVPPNAWPQGSLTSFLCFFFSTGPPGYCESRWIFDNWVNVVYIH